MLSILSRTLCLYAIRNSNLHSVFFFKYQLPPFERGIFSGLFVCGFYTYTYTYTLMHAHNHMHARTHTHTPNDKLNESWNLLKTCSKWRYLVFCELTWSAVANLSAVSVFNGQISMLTLDRERERECVCVLVCKMYKYVSYFNKRKGRMQLASDSKTCIPLW